MKKKLIYFNNEEKNGVFLLTAIILLFSIFIFLQKRILPSSSSIQVNIHELENEQDQLVMASFGNFEKKKQISIEKREIKSTEKIPTKLMYEVKSHISPSQDKINSLKTERDEHKEQVEINKSGKNPFKKFLNRKPKKIKPFNLNSQNPEDWKQIKGIGDGFSTRIIKYQNWLGGFHSADQLSEVYGLTDSLIQVIVPHLQNTQNFKKIKINEADVKAFGKHPYLEWKDANLIVKFRKHHYPLTPKLFNQMIGISDETKAKISPYLDFTIKIDSSEIDEKSQFKISNENESQKIIVDSIIAKGEESKLSIKKVKLNH